MIASRTGPLRAAACAILVLGADAFSIGPGPLPSPRQGWEPFWGPALSPHQKSSLGFVVGLHRSAFWCSVDIQDQDVAGKGEADVAMVMGEESAELLTGRRDITEAAPSAHVGNLSRAGAFVFWGADWDGCETFAKILGGYPQERRAPLVLKVCSLGHPAPPAPRLTAGGLFSWLLMSPRSGPSAERPLSSSSFR